MTLPVYRLHGCKENGSLVIFGHGFPFSHVMWDRMFKSMESIPSFLDRYTMVAPDFRSMGIVDRQDSVDSPVCSVTTMADLADDMAELADQFHARQFFYCGLSMGSYVGWEIWNRYPDRLKGLIIADSNAGADSPEAAANRIKTALRVEQELSCRFLADAMAGKLFSPETLALNENVVQEYKAMVVSNNYQGVAAVARGMAQRSNFTDRLPEIDVPALVIGGQRDILSPPSSMESISQSMPNARHVVIPYAGHLSPMESPTAFAVAVKSFLDSVA